MHRLCFWAVSTLTCLALVRAASGVAEIKSTLQDHYKKSEPLVLGQITDISSEQKAVTLKTTETIKGKPFPEKFRLVLDASPEFWKSLAVDQPAVMFGSVKPG